MFRAKFRAVHRMLPRWSTWEYARVHTWVDVYADLGIQPSRGVSSTRLERWAGERGKSGAAPRLLVP